LPSAPCRTQAFQELFLAVKKKVPRITYRLDCRRGNRRKERANGLRFTRGLSQAARRIIGCCGGVGEVGQAPSSRFFYFILNEDN
jgi:hypothetical protein